MHSLANLDKLSNSEQEVQQEISNSKPNRQQKILHTRDMQDITNLDKSSDSKPEH
jgi:hypothetical protein